MSLPRFSWSLTSNQFIVLVAAFITLLANATFFAKVFEVYPPSLENAFFLLSVAVIMGAVLVLLLSALCQYWVFKPVLVLFLLTSAAAAYFMDSYGVVIDVSMMDNVAKTDRAEAFDLLNGKLFAYLLLLGILPSWLVYRIRHIYTGHWSETISRLKLAAGAVALVVALMAPQSGHFASFLREHKHTRFYANPGQPIFAAGQYVHRTYLSRPLPFKRIALDARRPKGDPDRELVILVLGETARADHFSLNGYKRNTNPLLAREKVISFSNFWSCGTSTAISVPCIFSPLTEREFSVPKARAMENVLDVLKRAGVHVLWRENNSSSKGVADRVRMEYFKSPKVNPVCDVECRDEGMLAGLSDYINSHPEGDILIVLHQMGNHGPAYYKRYPKAFAKFKPTCDTNELGSCSRQEIVNTYDNALLYTDYFLSKVIALLKEHDDAFETAMIYLSDHGESLGENGIYLHGMPNFLAPDAQRHVPLIMWFGKNFEAANLTHLERKAKQRLSHDNMFATLLGLFEIETKAYDPKMDILDHSHHENEIAQALPPPSNPGQ